MPAQTEAKPEIDYKTVRSRISSDGEIWKTRKTITTAKSSFEKLLGKLDNILSARMRKIVIENGLGYETREDLEEAFPEANVSLGMTRGASNVLVSGMYTKGPYDFYYSTPLHAWVAGLPEEREDGLYCQITGEKISNR